MALVLRDYQREANEATNTYMATTGGNPLVVIPTGGGKSLVMATHAREAIEGYPGTRVMNLTSFPELIRQNYEEVVGIWPNAPAGIYSAKIGKKNVSAHYLFAGIQSIHRKGFNLQPVDIVQVDEAHLIPRKSDTMYMRFLNDLRQINPNLKIVGYSATPFRMDSGMLHEGKGAMFDAIAYEIGIRQLIDDGYLAPLTSRPAQNQMQIDGVASNSGGDFVASQLEAAATDPDAVKTIAREIVANAEGRQGIMVYCCGKDHSRMMREALREAGMQAEMVFGDTPAMERNNIVANFKRKRLRCLVSIGVFTTGFNAKHVDMIALCRPTKSTGLYVQICGRGTRLTINTNLPTAEERLAAIAASDKRECLVLDFGGNIARHGPIDRLDPPKKKPKGDEKGEMPLKQCPSCDEFVAIAARECVCGFRFPDVVQIVHTQAAHADIMSRNDLVPEWIDVTRVSYARHTKLGKPDSLRVSYQCGLMEYREWICLEHEGGIKKKAVAWWIRRTMAGVTPPATVAEAMLQTHTLDTPAQIAVRPSGKFTEIVSYQGFKRDRYQTGVAA